MKLSEKSSKTPQANTAASQVGSAPPQANKKLWHDPFVHILLILVTGCVVYLNSLHVPFIFDDYSCLVNNPAIKSFHCFPDTYKVFDYSIAQDLKNNLVLRPVAYFSFAVNYALHGLDLFGYHLVNLLLHLGCAVLTYLLFLQLMSSPAMAAEDTSGPANGAGDASYLPLFAALLFVCHPLQTQAVTYIVQRFVPLATFFYLAALVLYVHVRCASTSTARIPAYICSLAAAVLAMESKEIAFTLPLVVALVEFMFFSGRLAPRLAKLLPFILTMAIIPAKLMQLSSPAGSEKTESVSRAINLINFGGISSWDYLMTQFGVIATYIRLLFLPTGQNFDYDYPLQQHFFKLEVLLPLALLLLIVGIGFYCLKRSGENRLYKIIAFGIFWFFITLSVESSIVPITDLIFEHRVYLPSVGFFMALLAGAAAIFRRITKESIASSKTVTVVLAVLVLSLSSASIMRNRVWQNKVDFWKDVVKKSPCKARGYLKLGTSYMEQVVSGTTPKEFYQNKTSINIYDARIEAAINAYLTAQRLKLRDPVLYISLGQIYLMRKDQENAESMFSLAEQLHPYNPWQYITIGNILLESGDVAGARKRYLKSIELVPNLPESHLKLAATYKKEGKMHEAIKELEYVMQMSPDDATRQELSKLRKNMK